MYSAVQTRAKVNEEVHGEVSTRKHDSLKKGREEVMTVVVQGRKTAREIFLGHCFIKQTMTVWLVKNNNNKQMNNEIQGEIWSMNMNTPLKTAMWALWSLFWGVSQKTSAVQSSKFRSVKDSIRAEMPKQEGKHLNLSSLPFSDAKWHAAPGLQRWGRLSH